MPLPKTVAFVGTGATAQARVVPGSLDSMVMEACTKAIANAGLKKSDIDGIITTYTTDPHKVAEMMGIKPAGLLFFNENGSGSSGFASDNARWALQEGLCNYVLMVCSLKESPGRLARQTGRGRSTGGVVQQFADPRNHGIDLNGVWGPHGVLAEYAMIAQRHMYEFGTKWETLGALAASQRYNASLNPAAVYRTPVTIQDVLNSEMIAWPFTMLMCAAVNDGAMALVMTTYERARDLPNKPVYILGSGSAHTGYTLTKMAIGDPQHRFDMVRTVGTIAAATAYGTAGVSAKDMDFVQSAEHFIVSPLLILEDYGFCAKGDAGPFIGDGTRTRVGGDLPFNTYGGETSGTHSPGAHGALVEAVRQLQGVCGDRQVKDCHLGLFVSTCGKVSTHTALVLSNE